MSEHKNTTPSFPAKQRLLAKGDAWRGALAEAARLSKPRLWASNLAIRGEDLVLKSGPRMFGGQKPYRLERRDGGSRLLGPDGKKIGVGQKIKSSMKRALAFGLGKLKRLG